jgi:phospholipid/cholesterol/gamma-HCH transport system permease protein
MDSEMADAAFVNAVHDPAGTHLRIGGDWTLTSAGFLDPAVARIASAPPDAQPWLIEAHALTRLDTTGALLLVRALRASGRPLAEHRIEGMSAADLALLRLVANRLDSAVQPAAGHPGFRHMLERVGSSVARLGLQTRELLGFVGLMLATLAQVILRRKKLRSTATVFHMEQVGLDAVPIVALLSFLVGAVVAFLGATVLRDFGAAIFTVELVSYSFLREFGVLLTAILLAGRSGSAFTAQIGSMKSREELDAIQALGLDAVELLVLPRLLALLVMLPALTFIAMIAGIVGGGIVGSMSLDITPGMFIGRLHEMTGMRHFWVGMAKAPVFAFLISAVGCLEGFKVEGSAESVGRHTTASVVQSIFLVIVFDAMFAMFFMKLHL